MSLDVNFFHISGEFGDNEFSHFANVNISINALSCCCCQSRCFDEKIACVTRVNAMEREGYYPRLVAGIYASSDQ